MEEDKNKHILEKKRTKKLNCPFALKLLQENFNTPGVPFSWDRIPANTYQTPPTPPPSSRWQPSAIEVPYSVVSLAETMEGLAENGKTCSTKEPDDANQSPDFMIQRFPTHAQDLAAASPAQKKLMFSPPPSSIASFSRQVGASNVKGCGFRSLYRLLVKPKGRTPPGASKSDSTKDSTNRQKKS